MRSTTSTRQSISLPSPVAKRVKRLVKGRRVSANRVLVDLIVEGLESKEREKREFFELAERLPTEKSSKERKRIKQRLAELTFGV